MSSSSPSSSSRKHDIIVFGATGFTGAFVAIDLAKILAGPPISSSSSSSSVSSLFPQPSSFRFAVAGRDRKRLEAVIARIREAVPSYTSPIDILLADVQDYESLVSCASQGRVLIDCVGPFRFYGEAVVKACVQAGSDFVDITGEPEFLERMELKYGEEAAAKQVHVVGCCGFDSIPADMGVLFAIDTLRQANCLATAVESYFTISGGPKGFRGHYATWESAVNGFGSIKDLSKVRKEYLEKHPAASSLPVYGSKLPRRGGIFYFASMGKWAMPFMGSDPSVVRRTQRSLVIHPPPSRSTSTLTTSGSSSRSTTDSSSSSSSSLLPLVPVQYAGYFTLKSTYFMLVTAVCGSLISFFAQWKWGRKLLLAFPRFFTYGMFNHEGPTAEQRAATTFSMVFYARGYSKQFSNAILASPHYANNKSKTSSPVSSASLPKPDVEAIVKVAGPEPGYVSTPKIVLSAAFTLLLDKQITSSTSSSTTPTPITALPFTGGVFTPATAFRGTRLIERMTALGIEFSVVQAPKQLIKAAL